MTYRFVFALFLGSSFLAACSSSDDTENTEDPAGDGGQSAGDGGQSASNENSEATPWASSEPLTSSIQESYFGTYVVTDYLVSETDCGPGESQLAEFEDGYMQAHVTGNEEQFLTFGSCVSPASCQEVRAGEPDPGGAGRQYVLESAVSDDYLRGTDAWSEPAVDGMCEDRLHGNTILERHADGTITLRMEVHALPPEPADEDGYCWIEYERFEEEARDEPCTKLRQVELTPLD